LSSHARDRARQRSYRGEPEWDDPAHGLGFIQSTVIPAADHDADIFRAVMRRELQLDPVRALAENTAVLKRARTLACTREQETDQPTTPTRESLLELISAAKPTTSRS
jgi:hypothetical protein